MLKQHVVIVGGGWAGIRLAKKLKKLAKHQIKITLVSSEANFRYSAALYRVATGHKEKEAILPIHNLIKDIPGINFIRATMTDITTSKRQIQLGNGATLHYDYAIIAIGSVTTYFNIPGVAEHAYSIKTQKELRRFRSHLHQELLDDHAVDKHYVIVGAGPTGVELSAGLASYLKVVAKRHNIKYPRVHIELIEAAQRVLPASHPKASSAAMKRLRSLGVTVHLNSKVERETETTLTVKGRSIPTKTVVWTAGVANNPFFAKRQHVFLINQQGKVIVDDHLRVNERLYVIGDNAVTPYSGLGLTAVHNAAFVAQDIEKRLFSRLPTPAYRPLMPATIIPIGKRWAIFQYKSIIITGFFGALLRSVADFVAYNDIAGPVQALSLWAHSNDLDDEQCVLCRTVLAADKHGIIAGLSEQY